MNKNKKKGKGINNGKKDRKNKRTEIKKYKETKTWN